MKRCEMKRGLLNQDRQLVAMLSIIKKNSDAYLMQIALPLLVDLQAPIKISIDGE